ncbi:MAG: universal stress protein [Lysobacterales bacterium]
MKRFRNILVVPAALELHDAAIQRGIRLCQSAGADMTLLWPQNPASDNGTGFDHFPKVLEEIHRRIAAITHEIESNSWAKVTSRVEVGKLFVEVLRRVQTDAFDLVLKTARGRSLGHQMLFGGDALHLIRKCPCPVWIVDPQVTVPNPIVAAVDPMPTDAEARNVAKVVLQVATSMAALDQAPVHVVHAWATPGERIARDLDWLKIKPTDEPSHVDAIKERHAQALNVLIEPFLKDHPDLKTHLVRGQPETVIPAVAEEYSAGTLVMASMARSDVPGLLIGSAAEVILHDANRSVLVVKPENYVAPVVLD